MPAKRKPNNAENTEVVGSLRREGALEGSGSQGGAGGGGNDGGPQNNSENSNDKNPIYPVQLTRTRARWHRSLLLSVVIEKSTEKLLFDSYDRFMKNWLCKEPSKRQPSEAERNVLTKMTELIENRVLPYTDADAYRTLKVATEAFVAANCGVVLADFGKEDGWPLDLVSDLEAEDPGITPEDVWQKYLIRMNGPEDPDAPATIPYLLAIRTKLGGDLIDDILRRLTPEQTDNLVYCEGVIKSKLTQPCLLELIWSYWHEQGMLVQTMNAISRRFQNIRGSAERDPLAMLEIDPLRPLNNLLWGYIQDEQHRLSLVRRAYEYDHHYGLALDGKAVPPLRTADSRPKFLEAFHNLLYLCSDFFKQDDDATVKADGFPLLNGLKDVHMLLVEGAHNQFGDLPSTARIEMMMQQWLLARPEFREFLSTRTMVDYPEPWMDRVEAMKKLQGWSDAGVQHFRNLGVFGEKILLSIRYIEWSNIAEPWAAVLWARFWRAKIQGYLYAYRAVTGVDLVTPARDSQQAALRVTQPSELLRRRLTGRAAPALPAGVAPAAPQGFRQRRAARKLTKV